MKMRRVLVCGLIIGFVVSSALTAKGLYEMVIANQLGDGEIQARVDFYGDIESGPFKTGKDRIHRLAAGAYVAAPDMATCPIITDTKTGKPKTDKKTGEILYDWAKCKPLLDPATGKAVPLKVVDAETGYPHLLVKPIIWDFTQSWLINRVTVSITMNDGRKFSDIFNIPAKWRGKDWLFVTEKNPQTGQVRICAYWAHTKLQNEATIGAIIAGATVTGLVLGTAAIIGSGGTLTAPLYVAAQGAVSLAAVEGAVILGAGATTGSFAGAELALAGPVLSRNMHKWTCREYGNPEIDSAALKKIAKNK